MAKKWLFWFCEGSVCVSGQNQMCRLCGCLKLFLKNAGRQKKIKKHWGGLSVGLLAVPFQYGLYVFGHLSKWFVFVLMFKFWSVYRLWNGRPTIGYNSLIGLKKKHPYLPQNGWLRMFFDPHNKAKIFSSIRGHQRGFLFSGYVGY